MKITTILSLTILLLFSFLIADSKDNKKPQWKGKVGYENGIKVIKNPQKPLYGEIILDLEEDLSIGRENDENYTFYRRISIDVDRDGNIFALDIGNHRIQKFDHNGDYLQTIGRKGQGPGEFAMPMALFIDKENNLYIRDQREIEVFDNRGNYLKKIQLKYSFFDFAVASEGTMYTLMHEFSDHGVFKSLTKLNPEGEKVKIFDKILGKQIQTKITKKRGGVVGGVMGGIIGHPVSEDILFTLTKDNRVIYGRSTEYKLMLLDEEDNIVLIIKKEEKPISFSDEERKRFQRIVLPSHKPFFSDIIVDSKGRIWLDKSESSVDKKAQQEVDIFSPDGKYLYRAKIRHFPKVLKNGYLYTTVYESETGYISVKRYIIKNWDQIKEGI